MHNVQYLQRLFGEYIGIYIGLQHFDCKFMLVDLRANVDHIMIFCVTFMTTVRC